MVYAGLDTGRGEGRFTIGAVNDSYVSECI